MKIYVLKDNNNLISNVFLKREIHGLEEVEVSQEDFEILTSGTFGEYLVECGKASKVIKSERPSKFHSWNYKEKTWEDKRTLEEKLDYWESELIKIQKLISERKLVGLYPNQKNIDRKYFVLAKHKEISENIAFSIEKTKKKQEIATDSTV